MFKKKQIQMTPPVVKAEEPTLQVRLTEASITAIQATNIFKVAAENLDRASDQLDDVAAEAQAEADALVAMVEKANAQAEKNRAQASAIRTAVGVN